MLWDSEQEAALFSCTDWGGEEKGGVSRDVVDK